MDAFVERAMEKIKEQTSRRDRELRDECDRVAGEIARARAAGARPVRRTRGCL